MNITAINIKNVITEKAKSLGFEKIGFARYDVLEKESGNLRNWLDKGYDADMQWIRKGFEKRRDIRNIIPDAKSIISLAYNYYTPFEHDETKPKISRYAWGKDYHKVLKKKLKLLCNSLENTSPYPLLKKERIKPNLPLSKGESDSISNITSTREIASPPVNRGFAMKYYVDDGPVMDKTWAVRAGLGWQGKHTNVINPDYGSWFFIANIITNIEFDSYDSPIEDLCGSCTLCISACPTGAIADEYVVDSNKCISYHTIENRGEIPADINLDGWIFGCDACQDVCPYNSPKYNRVTDDESFYPMEQFIPMLKAGTIPLPAPVTRHADYPLLNNEGIKAKLIPETEEAFKRIFAESPIKRTKFKGFKRNIKKII